MAHRKEMNAKFSIEFKSLDQLHTMNIQINPLSLASSQNDEKTVNTIIADLPNGKNLVNQEDEPWKKIPLAYALESYDQPEDTAARIVKTLLEQKSNIEHNSVKEALTKLYKRALSSRDEKLMTFVLSISTDMVCRAGLIEKTPLSEALAACNSFDDPNMIVVKTLLAKGAKSDHPAVEVELGKLFIKATQAGNWEWMKFILNVNPDFAQQLVNLQDERGNPLFVSVLKFCINGLTTGPVVDMINLFLKHHANPKHPKVVETLAQLLSNAIETLGSPPFDYIKFLLAINPEIVNVKSDKGYPLTQAYTRCARNTDNYAVLIIGLLERNADIRKVPLENYTMKCDIEHQFLATMPGPLNTLDMPTKGKYLARIGHYYESLIATKRDFMVDMYRCYLLAAQNGFVEAMRKIVFGGTTFKYGPAYSKEGHTFSLYALEKYSMLVGKSCSGELSLFQDNIKPVNQFRMVTFKIRSHLNEILPIVRPGKVPQTVITEIRQELKNAVAEFSKEFSKDALIELYKIKALIVKKENNNESLELYRKAATLGDLHSAELGITLAKELKDNTSLRFFYTEAIKAAKVYVLDELASNLQNELDSLNFPALVLEVKDDIDKAAPNLDDEISSLFKEINTLVRIMGIKDCIDSWKSSGPLDINKLLNKFHNEGEDDVIFNLLHPLFSQFIYSRIDGIENLFKNTPPATRLRKHAITSIKTELEKHLDKKALYAELLYLECFTSNLGLQISGEEKQAQMIKAAGLFETLLEEATRKEQWQEGIKYAEKIKQLRENAAVILEQKEDTLNQFTAAKIRNELNNFFWNALEEEKGNAKTEVRLQAIRDFFKNAFSDKISKTEQHVYKDHFKREILPKLMKLQYFTNFISAFFDSHPRPEGVIEYRKELINFMKENFSKDRSPSACLNLSNLECKRCTTHNTELKLIESNEVDQSLKLQIDLNFLCAKNSEKNIEVVAATEGLKKLSELKTLPPALQKEAKDKLSIIQFKQYSKNPKDKKSEEHQKELQKYAKEGVFPAVFELFDWFSPENGQTHGFSLGPISILKKEYIGRRLYLSAKLQLLNADQAQQDFPEIPNIAIYQIRPAQNYLQPPKPEEDQLLATWYKLLIEKIVPLMKKAQCPTDISMLKLFNEDIDAFMLKAPDVYGHFEHKQEASVIKRIRDRIKNDMTNAYGDKDWVSQKIRKADALTINASELETKAPAAAVAVSAAAPSRRSPTRVVRAHRESLMESVYPSLSAEERKSPVIAAPIPVFITQYEPTENKVYRTLYVAVLTLLAGQKSTELYDAQKILNDYVSKPVGPKDPNFPFFLLASWYSHLVNFIVPAIHSGEDNSLAAQAFRRDQNKFIELSTQSYKDHELIRASGITQKDIQTHIIPGIKKSQEAYELTHSTLGPEPVVTVFAPSAPLAAMPAPGPGPGAFSLFHGAGVEGLANPTPVSPAIPAELDLLTNFFDKPAVTSVATGAGAGANVTPITVIDESEELLKLFAPNSLI